MSQHKIVMVGVVCALCMIGCSASSDEDGGTQDSNLRGAGFKAPAQGENEAGAKGDGDGDGQWGSGDHPRGPGAWGDGGASDGGPRLGEGGGDCPHGRGGGGRPGGGGGPSGGTGTGEGTPEVN